MENPFSFLSALSKHLNEQDQEKQGRESISKAADPGNPKPLGNSGNFGCKSGSDKQCRSQKSQKNSVRDRMNIPAERLSVR